MSGQPPTPERLQPLAPGYSPRQVELDAEMVELGRPALSIKAALDPKALAAHRAAVEAWEYAHPEQAARWLELRAQAETEWKRLYAERYGPEAYTREHLRRAGFDDIRLVERAMRELRDSACFAVTRDWLRDGTTWSLVLTGPPGCGKSQAAYWAIVQLLTRNGYAPWCVTCPKASEASHYGGEAEEYRWRCAQAGSLLLDDLGEGDQTNPKRTVWRDWVDDVLTQRYAARRKTIITTNRSTLELASWLGARLVDRINEGIIISTNEQSMRGKIDK